MIQHEPVSQLTLGQHILQTPLNIIIILATNLPVEQTVADTVEHEGDESVAEVEEGDGAEEGVPEPEDEVDLLVDDVLGEDAHAVMNLNNSRSSNIRNAAAGDGGEHIAHGTPEIRKVKSIKNLKNI